MAVIDGGGGGPTLNPKAKHFERQLFKVFSTSTSTIFLTQEDWRAAKTQLENLAKDVQQVRTELQTPSDGGKGWQGPAAEAALSSLEKLGTTLDGHATKVGEVDTSLGQVYQAISDAKAAWYSDVASISTYVDPADHTRLPAPYLPTAENREKYSVPDAEAAAAAEDALWEERNQAAKKVLDQLGADTQTATTTMPIETKTKSETPYSPSGPGPSTNYPTGTSTPSTSGGYQVGSYGQPVYDVHPTDTGGDPGGEEIPIPHPEEPEEITIGDPEGPDPVFDPISSDGDVTGTTGVTGPPATGASSAAGGGGGGVGLGSVAAGGVGAGAAGIGGILGGRGGGMFGGRGGSGVVPASGTQGRATGAGGRGGSSAVRSGGVGGRGAQVIPGGGQGRAATSARGTSVKGASGSGRYGVPKLDGRSNGAVPGSAQGAKGGARSGSAGRGGAAGRGGPAGRGGTAAGAAGAAGARGSRGERDGVVDTDNLTHEDEETWFEGTEESSPQVWE